MRLVEDRRIAGIVEYRLLPEGVELPPIPGSVKNCVGFLYEDARGQRQPIGTAFFLEVEGAGLYAVTSRHVLTDTAAEGTHDIYLRLNGRGGTIFIGMEIDDWTPHRDTEVAAIRFELPSGTECEPFRMRPHTLERSRWEPGHSLIATKDWVPNTAFLGAEVYITGLFESRPGKARNIPIIRTGMIAAMPGEPIDATENGHGVFPAFLIEARSIPGMSGSPVFVCQPSEQASIRDPLPMRAGPPETRRVRFQQEFVWDLLGVAYGHYRTPYRARGARAKIHRINTGIALVVPRQAIWDLIFSEEEQAMRKKEKQKREREDAPDIAADRTLRSGDEFERVLRHVSKRKATGPPPDSPDQGTKGT